MHVSFLDQPSNTQFSLLFIINIFFLSSFICLLVVYLVAGVLFNKYSKGASGKELIPNVNFWIDFPLLVKVRVKTSGITTAYSEKK